MTVTHEQTELDGQVQGGRRRTASRLVLTFTSLAWALALLLVAIAATSGVGAADAAPGASSSADCGGFKIFYSVTYSNGGTDSGCANGNDVTRADNPDLMAVRLHVSCSDKFGTDGKKIKSDLGGLQVVSFSIVKDLNKSKPKTCGGGGAGGPGTPGIPPDCGGFKIFYSVTYSNGGTDSGCANGNDVTRADNPDLMAVRLHVSCSDKFGTDGKKIKSDLGGLQVVSFSIVKDLNKSKPKTCGGGSPPPTTTPPTTTPPTTTPPTTTPPTTTPPTTTPPTTTPPTTTPPTTTPPTGKFVCHSMAMGDDLLLRFVSSGVSSAHLRVIDGPWIAVVTGVSEFKVLDGAGVGFEVRVRGPVFEDPYLVVKCPLTTPPPPTTTPPTTTPPTTVPPTTVPDGPFTCTAKHAGPDVILKFSGKRAHRENVRATYGDWIAEVTGEYSYTVVDGAGGHFEVRLRGNGAKLPYETVKCLPKY